MDLLFEQWHVFKQILFKITSDGTEKILAYDFYNVTNPLMLWTGIFQLNLIALLRGSSFADNVYGFGTECVNKLTQN